MLKELALNKNADKKTYKAQIADLEQKLALLQRQAKEQGMPVVIVFEGWEAAGKGTMINELLMPLDPRGYSAYFIKAPTEEEYFRPFLWRFWTKTPEKGRIALFDQSWYRHVAVEKADGFLKKGEYETAFEDINSFEKQLTDDGVLMIKFFLHISRDEQKKRLTELAADPATSWKVEKKDWKMNKKYDDYITVYEKMIQETDTEYAPWTIVEAQHKKFAKLKIFTKVADAMQAGLDALAQKPLKDEPTDACLPAGALASSVLDKIDLAKIMDPQDYKSELKRCQKKIREIEHEIYVRRIPIIIAYEGWDAAGKGGNIKRMVENLDPRGYGVIPICAPNDIEKSHHYLWRFWNKMPKAGHIAIFDRTWYGRVLVERIEGFCTCTEWRRAYREINEMEKQLTNFGTILIKFWLQIDKNEQLRRFEERENTPAKNYKITQEDWRNRDKWDAYEAAVNEMLFRTNTTYAPWVVVESEDKHYARIKALKTVIERAEKRL